MNTQKINDKKDLPWFQKPTVLRSVDMRTFGMGVSKTHLTNLWKKGGAGVLAILRADKAKETYLEKKDEE